MDFFEAQARAKKRTTRLVALFVLAVLGIIAVGYFAFVFLTAAAGVRATANGGGLERDYAGLDHVQLWQPGALIAFSLLTLVVVGLSALGKWLQLRSGGRAVAQMLGAREIALQTTDLRERQLLNIVEEMAIASGLPLPPVFILEDETGINAFAAGLTTSDAVVAVTRGTLDKLNRDELQGVIAHEFSHILNGDMRLNMRLTAVLFGILVIGIIGRGIVSSLRFSRPRRDSKEGGGALMAVLAAGIVLLILGYVGYFFGRLIQAAVSRQREFLADASAVQFTRNPDGITGALKKIGGYAIGSQIRTNKASELSHFFFAQGFRSSFGGLWATHPPLDERIRAVDASFDGKYYEPPEVVDVAHEAWPQPKAQPAPARSPLTPLMAVAAIGSLDTALTARSQAFAESIPRDLREATRTPEGAAAIVCGLLLDADDASLRARQFGLVKTHAGDEIAQALMSLGDSLGNLAPAVRLPLLLLTPPALRQFPPASLSRVLDTLDELVHADSRVSLFEFVLQKVLSHHLELGAKPAGNTETLSLPQVTPDIALVLSFAARLLPSNTEAIPNAFNAGAAQFAGLYPPLTLHAADDCTLEHLDLSLDRLGQAYGPVKKRTLTALATTLGYDGRFDVEELELLRGIASTLDCPMPPAI
jgi:Zn-dependent protease with chaperone function